MAQTPKLFLIACITIASLLETPYATADDSRELKVDEQPLSDALKIIANEFGVDIAFFPEATDGLDGLALAGRYTSGEAFDALLEDTELEYQALDNGTVVVRAKNQGGASDSKNMSPSPILMAQNQTSRTQTTVSSRSDDGATSVVTGQVTDARTSANLKGARVTIEETGQWTSTDDLGEFRISNVPVDRMTLKASYLGYEEVTKIVVVTREGARSNLQMNSALDEIVVLGTKSGRMQALNQERTARNSMTVLNADRLGNFSGTTIAEAMRRAPGVAFTPDPVTGDGTNVILRGLEPDLNQVTINGLRVLDDTGRGRSPNLSNILTQNIESVTISNTLLPSQDTNGAGGLVEIETASPLDRPARFFSASVEYGDAGSIFGDDVQIGGTVSGTFGANDDFGVSLSAAYRERESSSLSYSNGSGVDLFPGAYLPLNSAGEPITVPLFEIDPRTNFPFTQGQTTVFPTGVSTTQTTFEDEFMSVSGTIERQFGTHINLRFDVNYFERVDASYSETFRLFSLSRYDLGPVLDLGGEERSLLVSENTFGSTGLGAVFGDGFPGGVERTARFDPGTESSTTSIALRGDTTRESWDFKYSAGYSESKESGGDVFLITLENDLGTTGFFSAVTERSLLDPEALANVTDDGRVISIFAPLSGDVNGSPIFPLFTEEGFLSYNSVDSISDGFLRDRRGGKSTGEEVTLEISARYNTANKWLEYIEVGLENRDTEFLSPGLSETGNFGGETFILSGSPAQLGVDFGPGLFGNIGFDDTFVFFDSGTIRSLHSRIPSLAESGAITGLGVTDGSLFSFRQTKEDTLTGYIQAAARVGPFEVVGGFRMEGIDISSTSFQSLLITTPSGTDSETRNRIRDEARAAGALVSLSASQTEVIPRVLANFRFNEDLILRGSYGQTVSRPRLNTLTDNRTFEINLNPSFGENADQQRVRVTQGNPDLNSVRTHSFDVSLEWYTDDVGVLKASVFYKRIEDPLRTEINTIDQALSIEELGLPDIEGVRLLDDFIVEEITPFNDEDSDEIWGLVLVAERRFDFLPGFWSGFGMYANYMYTDSARTIDLNVSSDVDPSNSVTLKDIPFDGSPEHQGTFGLTYAKHRIDASLLYTEQARRLSSFNRFGLNDYDESFGTLDLEVAYALDINGSDIRLFVRGRDLLREDDETSLQTSVGGENGVPKLFTGGAYNGGRTLAIGFSGTF